MVLDLDRRAWWIGAAEQVNIPDSIDITVTATTRQAQGGEFEILFMPQGSSTGGVVTLVQGSETTQVTVDWLSGRIGIDKSDD
jgi:general secretion pathway protein H